MTRGDRKAWPDSASRDKTDRRGRDEADTDGRNAGDSDRQRQHWINQSLRSLYEEVANEPIPDSFKTLLDELDESDRARSNSSTEGSEDDERSASRTHS